MKLMRLAIIIPVFGQDHLTDSVLDSLRGDDSVRAGWDEVIIVDNSGERQPYLNETILHQGENLGWCRGTNAGLLSAYGRGVFDAFVCLNNDVALSPDFLGGIRQALAARPLVGALGTLYDDVYAHQKTDYQGPAAGWVGMPIEREVPFVDGTCLVIPKNTLTEVGFLDEQRFGQRGWGADYDYALRIREAGGTVMVTHRSYLNHMHQGTAKTVSNQWNALAGNEMEKGMVFKYGNEWRDKLWLLTH
jgi:GT2 family glycosyltransferase